MRDTQDPRLSRWLATEAGGEETAADAACAELFSALPRPLAPAGFAERVMARVAAEGALAGRAAWPLDWAALWLLAACAAALSLLPRWLPGLGERLAPETWASGAATLLVRLAHLVAALAPLGEGLLRIARWTALAANSPQVITAVALCALLATAAGRLLLGLLDERSSGHAQFG